MVHWLSKLFERVKRRLFEWPLFQIYKIWLFLILFDEVLLVDEKTQQLKRLSNVRESVLEPVEDSSFWITSQTMILLVVLQVLTTSLFSFTENVLKFF